MGIHEDLDALVADFGGTAEAAIEERDLTSAEGLLAEAAALRGLFREAAERLYTFDRAVAGPGGWIDREVLDVDTSADPVLLAWNSLPDEHEVKGILNND